MSYCYSILHVLGTAEKKLFAGDWAIVVLQTLILGRYSKSTILSRLQLGARLWKKERVSLEVYAMYEVSTLRLKVGF